MRLYIAILFSIFIANAGCTESNSHSKGVIHDTIYIEKDTENKLIGTTVLKSSEKNISTSWMHGLWLKNLTASECQGVGETPLPTKATSIKQPNDSTLVITATTMANCCYAFLGEVEVLNGNTLNLIYHGYGSYCECNCDYELTYTFAILPERFKPDKIKFVTVDGASKTPLPKIRIPKITD